MSVIKIPTLGEFAHAIQGYAYRLSLDQKVSQFDISGDVRPLAKQQSDEQPFYLTLAFLQRGTTPSTRTSCPTVAYATPGVIPTSEYEVDLLLGVQYTELGQLLRQGPRAVTFEQTSNPLRFRVMVPEKQNVIPRRDAPVSPEAAREMFAAMRASLE